MPYTPKYTSELMDTYPWTENLYEGNMNANSIQVGDSLLSPFKTVTLKKITFTNGEKALSSMVELLSTGVLFSNGKGTHSKQVAENVKTIFRTIIQNNEKHFVDQVFPDNIVRAATLNELVNRKVKNINVRYLIELSGAQGTVLDRDQSNSAGVALYTAALDLLGVEWTGEEAFLEVLKDISPRCAASLKTLQAKKGGRADGSSGKGSGAGPGGSSGNTSGTGGGERTNSGGQHTSFKFQQPYSTTNANFAGARQSLYARSCFRRL